VGDSGEVEDMSGGHHPDFRISYGDGRTAIGEVGWHEDPQIQEMWQNTYKQEEHQTVRLPEGTGQWGLRLMPGANIKALHQNLPGFIETLVQANVTFVEPQDMTPTAPLRIAADKLGIEYIGRASEQEPSRAIYLFDGGGGLISAHPDVIVDWIDSMLADPEYRDTTAKLLAVSDVDERHVFVMTGSRTPFEPDTRLQRISESLPQREPVVPSGISHVWLVPRFTHPDFGYLAALWIRGEGWSLVPVAVI
jgi:hypothetical protein